MKDIYIIGAGGFGREVAWLIERINVENEEWNIKGFIDDDEKKWGMYEGGYKVAGGCEYLKSQASNHAVFAVCAVGSASIRQKIIEKLQDSGVFFATLVDPSVIMSNRVEIGEGAIICAGTIVTVDVKIGKHVIINLDCTLGHDDEISDYVTIYPSVNVSGMVKIGKCTEIGTGTQIIQGKSVIGKCIVGAGSVVVKDITIQGTYVGCPARRLG